MRILFKVLLVAPDPDRREMLKRGLRETVNYDFVDVASVRDAVEYIQAFDPAKRERGNKVALLAVISDAGGVITDASGKSINNDEYFQTMSRELSRVEEVGNGDVKTISINPGGLPEKVRGGYSFHDTGEPPILMDQISTVLMGIQSKQSLRQESRRDNLR